MNKLAIHTDKKIPFNWDDIGWLQESVRDSFYGILSAFGVDPADSFILSGCEVSNVGSDDVYQVEAGYISLNGEVLKVAQQQIDVSGGGTPTYELEEVSDLSGSKFDDDDIPVELYKIRRAKLVGNGTMSVNAPTLIEKIIQLSTGDWIEPALNAGYTNVSGDPVKWRFNAIGNMEITGSFTADSPAGSTLFSLPLGYAPPKPRYFSFFDSVGDNIWHKVLVSTSGALILSDYADGGANHNNLNITIFK
jgi:hypothetical protein